MVASRPPVVPSVCPLVIHIVAGVGLLLALCSGHGCIVAPVVPSVRPPVVPVVVVVAVLLVSW